MLVEETQDSFSVGFPIYSEDLDVIQVGDFYKKDRVFHIS